VTILSGAAHGDGVDTVGVAITGAMVSLSPTIPRGPDKNGAQALPALDGKKNKMSAVGTSLGQVSHPGWIPPLCHSSKGTKKDILKLARGLCFDFSDSNLSMAIALKPQNPMILLGKKDLKRSLCSSQKNPRSNTSCSISEQSF
jgi:hypothetical protein